MIVQPLLLGASTLRDAASLLELHTPLAVALI